MKAPRVCGFCRQSDHDRSHCPLPPEERDRKRAWAMEAEEKQAIKEVGKLLMDKVPRARWQRALFSALAVAQGIEDKVERDRFEQVLKAIDN